MGVGGGGEGVGGIVLGGGRLHLRLGSGGRAGECSLELPPPAGRRPLACVSGRGRALGGGGGGGGAGKRVSFEPRSSCSSEASRLALAAATSAVFWRE